MTASRVVAFGLVAAAAAATTVFACSASPSPTFEDAGADADSGKVYACGWPADAYCSHCINSRCCAEINWCKTEPECAEFSKCPLACQLDAAACGCYDASPNAAAKSAAQAECINEKCFKVNCE